jgi:hypothetical protein
MAIKKAKYTTYKCKCKAHKNMWTNLIIRQNLTINGSGDQNKMNLCKKHYEVTLIELILHKVQWYPHKLDCGVQIIRGLLYISLPAGTKVTIQTSGILKLDNWTYYQT